MNLKGIGAAALGLAALVALLPSITGYSPSGPVPLIGDGT